MVKKEFGKIKRVFTSVEKTGKVPHGELVTAMILKKRGSVKFVRGGMKLTPKGKKQFKVLKTL